MVLQTIRFKKSKEFGEMTGFIERAFNSILKDGCPMHTHQY